MQSSEEISLKIGAAMRSLETAKKLRASGSTQAEQDELYRVITQLLQVVFWLVQKVP